MSSSFKKNREKREREKNREIRERVESRSGIRWGLGERILKIEWDERCRSDFAHVDSFIELSEGNNVVEEVYLDPYWIENRIRRSDENWEEKLGLALGNLESLKVLRITYDNDMYEDNLLHPDWEAVARVLEHIWQKITLHVSHIETTQTHRSNTAFARAIEGHPSIQRFETHDSFDFSTFGILLSALATLPALESTVLGHAEELTGAPITLHHPEQLTTLLRSPSLRSVEFRIFVLTKPVCQAIALALRTPASPITCLELTKCLFPDGDDDADSIVNALEGNSTLLTLRLVDNEFDEDDYNVDDDHDDDDDDDHDDDEDDDDDEGLCHAVTALLLVNATLTDLTIRMLPSANFRRLLPPFFMALKTNTSLKKLDLGNLTLSKQSLCEALCEFFANNLVLEELTLHCNDRSMRDSDTASWRTVLPFLRDSKTLKSFTFHVNRETMVPRTHPSWAYPPARITKFATLCCDTVASILEGNSSLEQLDIYSTGISADAYLSAIESLQMNTTLKMLRFYPIFDVSRDDEITRLIKLVKKNYGLEDLDEGWFSYDKTGELRTLLRLNRAGRHYLIQDMGSIPKGVEVLVAVRDHLDCLFYHLRENPLLCDIEHCYSVTGTVVSNGTVQSNKRQRTAN
jgi:hypothetical protein